MHDTIAQTLERRDYHMARARYWRREEDTELVRTHVVAARHFNSLAVSLNREN